MFSSQPDQIDFTLGYFKNEVDSSDQQLLENLAKMAKIYKSGMGKDKKQQLLYIIIIIGEKPEEEEAGNIKPFKL